MLQPESAARTSLEHGVGLDDVEALATAFDVLGDPGSLPIVAALLDGPLRYTEIQERLPALAPNILTARLRKLEQEGLGLAPPYSPPPPRHAHRPTAHG